MIENTEEAGNSVERDSPTSGPLYRFRIPLLLAFSMLFAASIALYVLSPRQYRSNLEIEVRSQGASGETADASRTQSELTLARSEAVASGVVDPDWLTQPSGARTPDQTRKHQEAIAAFERQLSIEVDPGSRILRIAFTAPDPHAATDLGTRFLNVFLASQQDTGEASHVTAFFIEDATQARSEFDQATTELDQYRRSHPASNAARSTALSGQIATLTQQMRETDAHIATRSAEILEGERHFVTVLARHKTTPNADSVLTTPQLNTMLAIYTDQRANMLTGRTAASLRDGALVELSHDIDVTSSELRMVQRPRPFDPASDPEWRETNDRVATASAELHRLNAERDQQTERLATLRQALAVVERPEPTLVFLQLKADAAHTGWQLAEQRSSEARIVEAMEQQRHGNLSVLLFPTFSSIAAGPGPWLILFCILTGLLLALLALAIYLQRPREENEESEAAAVSPFRDAASSLLRAASAEPRPQPERPELPPSPPVPEAQWQALASILLGEPEPSAAALPGEPETMSANTLPEAPLPPRVILPGPAPILTTAVPNFVFETLQSTVTTSSLSFSTAASTLVTARSLRAEPPSTAPPSVVEPQPQPTRPIVEVRTEPLPEPVTVTPLVEVRTEPLPSIAQPEPPPPPPPTLELEPELIPPVEIQGPLARLTPYQRMKRRRAVPTLDKNGRVTYLTYTFDPEPPRDGE